MAEMHSKLLARLIHQLSSHSRVFHTASANYNGPVSIACCTTHKTRDHNLQRGEHAVAITTFLQKYS